MDVFYCLVHTPEAITPELCVLPGVTQTEALHGLARVARDWPRLERIDLYCGNDEVRSFAPSDLLPHDPGAVGKAASSIARPRALAA